MPPARVQRRLHGDVIAGCSREGSIPCTNPFTFSQLLSDSVCARSAVLETTLSHVEHLAMLKRRPRPRHDQHPRRAVPFPCRGHHHFNGSDWQRLLEPNRFLRLLHGQHGR